MCSYCWAKSGLWSVKYLALLSSNTTSVPETHKVRHVGQHEDIGILVALGLTTHIETRLDFQTYPKKRFRKSDFQCHLCSFFTLVTLKNTNSIIRLRLIKARGEPGSEQGKTHSGGATTPSASPGNKSLQPYRRKQKDIIARDNARVWQQFNAKIYWTRFVSKGRRHHSAGPLYRRGEDQRIMQRKEKKQTAAVKGGGNDMGKRNHPQQGHFLAK